MFTFPLICRWHTLTQREVTVACPLPRATELACGNMPLVNLCDFGFGGAVRTTEARLCLLFCDVDKRGGWKEGLQFTQSKRYSKGMKSVCMVSKTFSVFKCVCVCVYFYVYESDSQKMKTKMYINKVNGVTHYQWLT